MESKAIMTFYRSLVLLLSHFVNVYSTCSGLPSSFVSLGDLDSGIIVEMRYAGYHNFVGHPIKDYIDPVCILTSPAAKALVAAQQKFLSMSPSYTIKVYDCYRPQSAVNEFVQWSMDPHDTKMKKEFYPSLNKSSLFPDGYIARKSGHSRGSTMDLTIVPSPPPSEEKYVPGQELCACYNPLPNRFHDNSIDMGTGFDCFSPLAHTNNSNVTDDQHKRRMLLKNTLADFNFTNYVNEWWHYTLDNEPYPNTYFDFPVQCKV